MPQRNRVDLRSQLAASARQTLSMAVSLLPILIGVVLLTGRLLELLPAETMAEWFGRSDVLDLPEMRSQDSPRARHPLSGRAVPRMRRQDAQGGFLSPPSSGGKAEQTRRFVNMGPEDGTNVLVTSF